MRESLIRRVMVLALLAPALADAQTQPTGLPLRPQESGTDAPLPIQGEKSTDLVLPDIVITGQARHNLESLTKVEVPGLTSLAVQSTFAEGKRRSGDAELGRARKETVRVRSTGGCLSSLGLAKLLRGERGRFDTAMRHVRGGKLIKAQAELEKLLGKRSDSPLAGPAHFWLGEIAFLLDDAATAEERYRIAALTPEPHEFQPAALYGLGWLLAQRAEHDTAIRAYEQLLKGWPEHELAPLTQLQLAEAHFLERRYRPALREFQKVVSSYPAAPFKDEAQFWMAECLYRLGRYRDAAQLFRQYSENFPTSRLADDALYGLGYALLKLGDPDGALDAFQQVMLAYPQSVLLPSAMSRIGDIYVAARRFDKASTAYDEVIERFPGDEGDEYARYRRIFMHHLKGDRRIVLELAQRFVDELPRSEYLPEVLFLAAEAHTALGNAGRAHGFYRRVAASDKPALVTAARFRSGLIAFLQEDFETALADFEILRTLPEAQNLGDEVLFWRAETLYRLGRYDEALGLYERVLRSAGLHDRFDDALFGIGWVHLRQGRFEQATEAFEKLPVQYPASPLVGESAFRLGQAQFYRGLYTQAVATLQGFVNEYPSSALVAQAHYLLGQSHQRRDAFHDAVRSFRDIAVSHPSDPLAPKALYQVGVSQLRLGSFEEAAATFTQLAAQAADPEVVRRSLLKGGDSLYNLGRYEEAQQLYREVARRFADSPEAADAQYGIGLAYYRMGRFDEFIDEARRMVRERPTSEAAALVQLLIGEQLFDRRELTRAIAAYEVILSKAPQSESADDALYRIALCHIELGQPEPAAAALQDLLRRYPTSPLGADALLHLGRLYSASEQHREAARAFARLVAEYPGSSLAPEARLQEGIARYRSGDAAGAERRLRELIERYAGSDVGHRARLELGLIYFQQEKDCHRALELFTLALRSENLLSAARAQFYVGECHARLGEADAAIAAFMKVAYLYPDQDDWSDRAQFRAASVYREQGQRAEALKVLRKVHGETRSPELRSQVQAQIREIEQDRR
jgi:TolA-binding protein